MKPYDEVLAIRCPDRLFRWTDRDAMLYALAIGMGSDPQDARQRAFIYEEPDLSVVPSFATVAAWGANPPIHDAGVDYTKVVHAAQEIILHRPMPASATIRPQGGMVSAIDKGDKGAIVLGETNLCDAETGDAFVTLRTTWMARADGHFGGPTDGGEAPHKMPERAPDLSVDYATRPDQAALYRLCGDRNPLHIDPAVAQRAGFPRPILHGLCTFGITCRAVLETFAQYDPNRIASHALRFLAPVYPSETITVDLWQDGSDISFEARVKARDAVVVRSGLARLR
ncbi:MaoC/PaaZ C-terminal domain-containing protein [Novosphingobium aquimarinum]|uniref:MaoC/PaaZ C-terminal domain-containing protein n=1 Tax=Novosphingobium aquimarinum TaxID=2682494 RepID=UPI0018DBBC22|nr:MaoC/PaaZ C-terminal domain-containing protein [Novosphingobium aquimarinum]